MERVRSPVLPDILEKPVLAEQGGHSHTSGVGVSIGVSAVDQSGAKSVLETVASKSKSEPPVFYNKRMGYHHQTQQEYSTVYGDGNNMDYLQQQGIVNNYNTYSQRHDQPHQSYIQVYYNSHVNNYNNNPMQTNRITMPHQTTYGSHRNSASHLAYNSNLMNEHSWHHGYYPHQYHHAAVPQQILSNQQHDAMPSQYSMTEKYELGQHFHGAQIASPYHQTFINSSVQSEGYSNDANSVVSSGHLDHDEEPFSKYFQIVALMHSLIYKRLIIRTCTIF